MMRDLLNFFITYGLRRDYTNERLKFMKNWIFLAEKEDLDGLD